MEASVKISDKQVKPMAMHPKKFGLWLFLITVVMLFASLTSAYLVKRGDGNWRVFDLPEGFYYTSIVVLLSSLTLFFATRAAKQNQNRRLLLFLWITMMLGVAFLIGQFFSWGELVNANVYFTGGNPSESFIYVLSGLHWLHLVSAIIYGVVILVSAYQKKLHSEAMVRLEMFGTYWHFLTGLWIYLFVFLMLYHQ